MNRESIDRKLYSVLKFCAIGIALLILLYLCILAFEHPKKELIFAILFEVSFFGAILLMRFLSGKRKSEKLKRMVVEEIFLEFSIVKKLKTLSLALLTAALAFVFSVVLIDFSAYVAGYLGCFGYAKQVYKLLPTYKLYDGAHPAFTMEVLSGASIEAGKFERAHQFTSHLLEVREYVYGRQDWMYGGMVANLANLYYKEGKFKEAENAYRQSIDICVADRGYKRLGSALTRLGNCLREQGRFEEARKAYEEGLAMRKKEFGESSLRVAETTRELALLMTYLKNKEEGDRYFTEVERILKSHNDEPKTDVISIVAFLLISILISFFMFGKNGFLTNLAIRKLEDRIAKAGSNADQKDVEKLIAVLELRQDDKKLDEVKNKYLMVLLVGSICINGAR